MSPAITGVSWETMARDLLSKFDDINLLSSNIDPVTLEDHKHYYREVGKIHKLRFQYDDQLFEDDEYTEPPVSGDPWEELSRLMYDCLDIIEMLSNIIKPLTLERYGVYRRKVEELCAHAHVMWANSQGLSDELAMMAI